MPFASISSTNPRTNPWNFHEKILRIGGAGKWGFFESAILIFFFQDFFFCFISMKTSSPYHLFLQHGWFLQNLGKDLIRTNMHTTVNGNMYLLWSFKSNDTIYIYIYCYVLIKNYWYIFALFFHKKKLSFIIGLLKGD